MSLSHEDAIAKQSHKNILAISVKTLDLALTAIGIIGIIFCIIRIYSGELYISALGQVGTEILITIYIILAGLKILDKILPYPLWLKAVSTIGTIGITVYFIGVLAFNWSGGFVSIWISGDFALTISITLIAVGEVLDYADSGSRSAPAPKKIENKPVPEEERYKPPETELFNIIDTKDECVEQGGTWDASAKTCTF